jgi:two-component system NarL family response regulator
MASAAAVAITFFPALRTVPRPIRVLTVDGHQLVQEGLAAMINREEDMTVVATASTGEEALDEIPRYRPDVVTLDLLLPDMPGEVLARRILAEFPRTRIVAITSAQGHMHARRALDAGVHGYLSKAAPACELVQAIRQVQAGGRTIPGPVAFRAAEHLTGEGLTAREIQILQLVAWGNGNRQVAARLSIAGETVRMHIRSILEKLAANDRAHAVTIAVTRGILRLGEGSASAWQQAADWTSGGEAHMRTANA